MRKTNEMKRLTGILCVMLLIGLLCGCGGDPVESKSPTEKQSKTKVTSYDAFVENLHKIQDIELKGFTLISENAIIDQAYTALPETKLDERKLDQLSDGQPSKYVFEFINDKKDVYVRASFLYYSMSDDGILLTNSMSPTKSSDGEGKNVKPPLPTTATDLISINGYTAFLEFALSTAAHKGSDSKNEAYLLKVERQFLSEIQDFLLQLKI